MALQQYSTQITQNNITKNEHTKATEATKDMNYSQ
jgi:hypothetical protein